MIDAAQVAAAWHLVHTDDPTEVVRWAARRGDTMQGSWAKSPSELVAFAHAYKDWDFYVQPNPTRKKWGVRVSGLEVSRWRWFLIDIDPVDGARPSREKLADITAWVQEAMNSYVGRRVHFIPVYSGRGVQLWVPLPPRELSGTLYSDIPLCQRYWLERLESRKPAAFADVIIDASACADLPRLFRCPGTVNRKTGEVAAIPTGIYTCGNSVIPNVGLDGKILAWVPTHARRPPPSETRIGQFTSSSWQAAVGWMTREGADFVTFGGVEPGRHRGACAAARSLAELGVAEEQIVEALTMGCSRSKPEISDAGYVKRTAREALKFVGRK